MLHTPKKKTLPTESIQQRKQKKIFPYRAKTAAGCWRWCCILSSVTFMLRSSLSPSLSGRAFELKITHRVGHQLKWEKMKREGIEWKMRLALAQNIFKFPTIILRFLHRLTTWTCCKLPEKLLHFLPFFFLFPSIVSIPTSAFFSFASLLLLSWIYSTELNLLRAPDRLMAPQFAHDDDLWQHFIFTMATLPPFSLIAMEWRRRIFEIKKVDFKSSDLGSGVCDELTFRFELQLAENVIFTQFALTADPQIFRASLLVWTSHKMRSEERNRKKSVIFYCQSKWFIYVWPHMGSTSLSPSISFSLHLHLLTELTCVCCVLGSGKIEFFSSSHIKPASC